jgi:hypothetical protein
MRQALSSADARIPLTPIAQAFTQPWQRVEIDTFFTCIAKLL